MYLVELEPVAARPPRRVRPRTRGSHGSAPARPASLLGHSDQGIGMPSDARGQHRFSTGPETTGNYRYQSGKSDARIGRPTRRLTASFTRDGFENTQFRDPMSPLEQLAGHDHALDLVGALVDLGDLGVAHHPLDRV